MLGTVVSKYKGALEAVAKQKKILWQKMGRQLLKATKSDGSLC